MTVFVVLAVIVCAIGYGGYEFVKRNRGFPGALIAYKGTYGHDFDVKQWIIKMLKDHPLPPNYTWGITITELPATVARADSFWRAEIPTPRYPLRIVPVHLISEEEYKKDATMDLGRVDGGKYSVSYHKKKFPNLQRDAVRKDFKKLVSQIEAITQTMRSESNIVINENGDRFYVQPKGMS